MPFTITQACVGCQACKKICPVGAISGGRRDVHVIDASVCIECGACGRMCPHASVLDQYGAMCTMVKRAQWKRPRVNRGECMSCTMCIETCPVNCLGLSQPHDSGNPHGYPYLREERACIGCGFCAIECPVGAITMVSPAS